MDQMIESRGNKTVFALIFTVWTVVYYGFWLFISILFGSRWESSGLMVSIIYMVVGLPQIYHWANYFSVDAKPSGTAMNIFSILGRLALTGFILAFSSFVLSFLLRLFGILKTSPSFYIW